MQRMEAARGELARHEELLRRAFGVGQARVEATQGGWSARAFVVDARSERFFLKVYDATQASVRPWIDRIDSYIHAQDWLARTPELLGRMPIPVRALNGEFKVVSGDDVYMMHHYIPGVTPGYGKGSRAQTVELAGILARLHGFGGEIPVDTSGLKEDISLWFCDAMRAHLDIEDQTELGDFLRPHRELLREAVRETVRLRDEQRSSASPLVLCHTDAHGNNLVQGEQLVLVDWEGLCVAPAEADLFMYATDPHWDAFLDAYRAARPGFALNRGLLRFYLLRRQTEDIWFDLLRLMRDHPGEAESAEVYEQLGESIAEAGRLLEPSGRFQP